MSLGRKTILVEQVVQTDAHISARKIGFAIHYLVRNAIRGEGDTHSAVDNFADSLCEFFDNVAKREDCLAE